MHGTRDIVLVSVAILFFWMSLYFYVPFLLIRALELGASNTLVGVVISSYAFGQILLRLLLLFLLNCFCETLHERGLLALR